MNDDTRSRGSRSGQPSRSPQVPVSREPPMRRWPHPADSSLPPREIDPALHYIRCALSYQNELLAEIKTLLQELVIRRQDSAHP